MDSSIKKRRAVLRARGNERDYMVRSEKRPGYRPPPRAPKPPKRRKHRRRQSLPYVFFTCAMLLALYPVGLVMLWMRTIRWTAATKLSLTAGFAMVFVLLASFALTVQVDDPLITHIQESTRKQLSATGSAIQANLDKLDLDPEHILRDVEDIAGYSIQLSQRAAADLLPTLEGDFSAFGETIERVKHAASEFGQTEARKMLEIINVITPAPTQTTATESSLEPSLQPSKAPSVGSSSVPGAQPTPKPTALLVWHAEGSTGYHTRANCPKLTGTAAPLTVTEAVQQGLLPCDQCAIPDVLGSEAPAKTAAPIETGASVAAGLASIAPEQTDAELGASPNPSPDSGVLSTRSATPGASPGSSPQPTSILLPPSKSAAEVTVYYTSNGKYYHTASSCGSMSGAKPHTLQEAVDAGLKRCNGCNAPDPSLLDAQVVVRSDANGLFHTADECENIHGKTTLLSLEDAIAKADTGCPECGANLYQDVVIKYDFATPVPAPPIG